MIDELIENGSPELRPPRVTALLLSSVAATGLAWVIPWVTTTFITSGSGLAFFSGLRVTLLIIGLLAAAFAVCLRPRFAVGLGVAALSAGQAALAIPPEWDTIRMAITVASVFAAVCTGLVLLPRPLQRFAVSLAILFHFGGILVAVTSVPPPFAPAPWLATQLWIRVYRPYFQFMYLFNAYHFYSPDPGPATLLWACINYSDDTHKWVRMPDRQEHMKDPLAVGYYRRLSLTEAANQLQQQTGVGALALEHRSLAGLSLGIPTPERIAEIVPSVPQYRPPNNYTQQILKSYAQRFARSNPPADPKASIVGVKIYRVVHVLLTPKQTLAGKDPTDADLYLPYFQGDFDTAGNLKNPADPMLYWFIPIVKIANVPVRPNDTSVSPDAMETANYLEIHATSPCRKGPK